MKKVHFIRKTILILLAAAVAVLFYFAISGYIKSLPGLHYTFGKPAQDMVSYPDTRFAVISDLHYYAASLGTTGPAFEEYLQSDRKLLKDSADLLTLAIDHINNSGAQFVLVPGDLTKDGELICHQKVSAALSKLTENGLKVYVIPGNHDINNPGAFRYEGDRTVSVPSVTPSRFADIYSKFGYGNAIDKDANSLSYVAEPVPGLWLVAIDSCRYRENKPGGKEIVGGKLSQNQEKWLEGILQKAVESGKAVMVMGHHGIVEHWTGQSKLHPNYLVEDYKYIGKLLASYNVRLAFTGHYHAQDITRADFGDYGFLYDIETGSLSTAPCAVRYCTLAGNKINILSDSMAGMYHPGTDFEKNAYQFVYDSIEKEAYDILRRFWVPDKDADSIAAYVAAGFIAHYKGNENEAEKPVFNGKALGLWGRIAYKTQKYVPEGLWKDLYPPDDNVTLDLDGG